MWTKGTFKLNGTYYHYSAKCYEQPSGMGINQGCISKLSLWKTPNKENNRGKRTLVCEYDRGWVVRPWFQEEQAALRKVLDKYDHPKKGILSAIDRLIVAALGIT